MLASSVFGSEAPTLSTTSVTFGTGSVEALIIFNHTSSHYVFDATINNCADNAAGSGTGDVLGRTAVRVINVGGTSLADDFVLVGDYITADGQQAVIGGAYAYALQANGDDTAGRSWYLSSALVPVDPEQGMRYQPGTVVYEQYPQVLAALNTVPTLQQRVGNRYWSPAGTAPGGVADNRGMWGRVEGSRMTFDPARSTTGSHRDVDLWRPQTGLDFALHEGGDGSLLMGGVNISYGTANAEMGSPVGRGKIDATGYGFGTSLTWYGAGGFYVDGQAQVMLFDSDLTSTTEGRRLTDGNSGHGLAFSVETGKHYGLGRGLFVTPQVQLVYAKVDFDSFTDPFRTRVSLKEGSE